MTDQLQTLEPEQNKDRSLPRPQEWDEGFWEAATRGKVVVQLCSACKVVRSFPRIMCAECGCMDHEWKETSGRATLYSWTVLRREFHPLYKELPYVVAIAELDDEPTVHLVGNIVGLPRDIRADPARCTEALPLGLPLVTVFERYGDVVLPQFKIADDR